VTQHDRLVLAGKDRLDRTGAFDRLVDACDLEHVVLLDAVVVGRVVEGERQDPEVHEVLPVDAGEALGHHQTQPEIARRERGVLAARSLAVVVAVDHGMTASPARRLRPADIALVDHVEGEGADLRDVAAKTAGRARPPGRSRRSRDRRRP
jgi:hypothetical protein